MLSLCSLSPLNAAEKTMKTVESSAWEFGIGLGIGERSNIIVNSQNINLNAFVHIAYIGDRFFFDNGDIGVYLTDNEQWNVNLVAGLNSERQFFKHLNQFGFTVKGAVSLDGVDHPVTIEPTKREKSIDGGIEVIGGGNWGNLQFQLNTDISNKHNGHEIWAGYHYEFSFAKFHLSPAFGVIYKSKNWADYFYGVNQDEATNNPSSDEIIRPPYQADKALNIFYRLNIHYEINDHWKIVGLFENELLDRTIRNSPIVDGKKITTHFLGVYYQF